MPGMAARRRIKSGARAPQRRRGKVHVFIALIIALILTGASYRAIQEAMGAPQEPLALISPAPIESFSLTQPPTEPSPSETPVRVPTAVVLPSLTPVPAEQSPTPTEPISQPTLSSVKPSQPPSNSNVILYYTQPGDTLPVVAAHFGVKPEEITSLDPIPSTTLITPGQLLLVPPRLEKVSSDRQLLPDSEFVFSPSAADFNIQDFISKTKGFLSTYREYLGTTGWTTGAEVIQRVALENSVNPRLLIALLEQRAHWVSGQPTNLAEQYYPMGYYSVLYKGLYMQLTWAVDKLSIGYYAWREGRLNNLDFPDGTDRRLAPTLNAGTVGLLYFYSRIENEAKWAGDLYPDNGLAALYERLFGSPWLRARSVEPLFPLNLTQPELNLPWYPGQVWSFSGGPHSPWSQQKEGARSALDFAPSATEPGCIKSDAWVMASASGLVTRSEHGVVVIDLDGDGREETGWVLLYLHIATDGRIPVGEWVEADEPIGHPSCEGGNATGTHVHFARKYNGEWISADGPLPFTLSGYTAHAGKEPYQGSLTKGNEVITACTCGSFETRVQRPVKDEN